MIFCVEDDSAIRELITYTLQASGFETKGFVDGDKLWDALSTEIPQLIMLDIMLPGEDGIEILKNFLENPGMVFTREQLLQSVWNSDYVGETRTVDVHIGTLRTKLGICGDYIKTIRGVGYRVEVRE